MTGGGSWEGKERQSGVPSPSPSHRHLLQVLHSAFVAMVSVSLERAAVEPEPVPALGGGKQPRGRFPVCPKSFLRLLDEREGKLCGVQPPIHFNVFFFSFYVFP